MEIKHKDDGKKGAFYINDGDEQLAILTYTHAGPQKIILDHTEVNSSLKGEGVGYKLVDAVVAYMRDNNLKAIPLCPFANAVFKKKEVEYSDVRV